MKAVLALPQSHLSRTWPFSNYLTVCCGHVLVLYGMLYNWCQRGNASCTRKWSNQHPTHWSSFIKQALSQASFYLNRISSMICMLIYYQNQSHLKEHNEVLLEIQVFLSKDTQCLYVYHHHHHVIQHRSRLTIIASVYSGT